MPDNRQPFAFAPAKRQGVGLFVGVAGGTGSGKTYSALRLARGIAGPNGRIAAVDTEARRMSHYAGQFQFDVTDMAPPFRPSRFAQAAEDAERAGYAVLVIDSFSLEWTGEGGVLDWHDEIAGDDPKKNMQGWIKPKGEHKAMISSFLQRRIPLVFCFRAEEKVKVGAGGRPEPMGWMPIGDSRFMFELTTMLTLSNEAPGMVSYKLPRKIQEQHLPFFPDGQPITERAGELLAGWARGEEPVDKAVALTDALIAAVRDKASEGDIAEFLSGEREAKQVAWLKSKRPELYTRLNDAISAKRGAMAGGLPL
jgi:hypothetical protein